MTFFTMTIQNDPRFHSPNLINDVGLLDPTTAAAIQMVIAQARRRYGYSLFVYETFRSQERQQLLAAVGSVVAGTGMASASSPDVYYYGLACTIVKYVYGAIDWKQDYSFLKSLAESNGLLWGGDYGNPLQQYPNLDVWRLQRVAVADQAKLFAGGWYPPSTYTPVTPVSTPTI